MKIIFKYAVIFVILSFVWNCLELAVGLQGKYISIHPYFVTPFFIILTSVIYYLALRDKRNDNGGKITFGNAIVLGLILTLVILIINPIFLYVFYQFINPDFFNAFIGNDVQSGKLSISEANDYYNMTNFIVRGSLYRFVMGMLAAIIIFLCMKKDLSK